MVIDVRFGSKADNVRYVPIAGRLGSQMRKAVHWIASIAAAGLIVFLLERFLPATITRVCLIAIGGLAGMLWWNFVDRPLKAGARGTPE